MADDELTPPPVRRHDSQATSVSLELLDPEPVNSPEVERSRPLLETDDDTAGANKTDTDTHGVEGPKGGSSGAPGLSGSGHGAVYYLTRIQKYSTYAMTLFTSLHLCNVSLIPATTASVDASETYLLMTREIYQTSIAEPLLIALPIAAHVGSGIALRLVRRFQNARRYGGRPSRGSWWSYGQKDSSGAAVQSTSRNRGSPWPAVSYISMAGYGFLMFFAGHVAMNRVVPLIVEGDSSNIGLAYVAHGFARHPAVSWMAYTGLILTTSWHVVWGTAKFLGRAPSTRSWLQPRKGGEGETAVVETRTRRERRRKWTAVHGIAAGLAALWAVGGLGVVARAGASDGWVGTLYDQMFAKAGLL